MNTYNITWKDKASNSAVLKGCNIEAHDLTELELKFKEKYPTGSIQALMIVA